MRRPRGGIRRQPVKLSHADIPGDACKKRYNVERYRDPAVGVLDRTSGRLAITRVTLRPEVRFAGERTPSGQGVATTARSGPPRLLHRQLREDRGDRRAAMIKVLRLTAEVSILGPRSRSDRISGSESKDQRPNRVKTVYPIAGLRGTIYSIIDRSQIRCPWTPAVRPIRAYRPDNSRMVGRPFGP